MAWFHSSRICASSSFAALAAFEAITSAPDCFAHRSAWSVKRSKAVACTFKQAHEKKRSATRNKEGKSKEWDGFGWKNSRSYVAHKDAKEKNRNRQQGLGQKRTMNDSKVGASNHAPVEPSERLWRSSR